MKANYYGRLVRIDPDSIAGYIPVICGHGGSMWLWCWLRSDDPPKYGEHRGAVLTEK